MTAGKMRTQIAIEERDLNRYSGPTINGYERESWHNIDGEGHWRWCQWIDAYGNEALIADQAGIEQLATVRCRYTPKITATCRVFRREDIRIAEETGVEPRAFEVFGVHSFDDNGHWLEFKVQRRGASL